MTPLDAIFATARQDGPAWVFDVPDDWRQGRSLYGGISAGLCLEAAQRLAPDAPPLRSGQVSFVGPASGEARVQARLLRRGKSAVFVGADLFDGDQPATSAVFCFGAARDSRLALAPQPLAADAPAAPPPDKCPPVFGPVLRPNFAQHFDTRVIEGSAPFSGGAPHLAAWARYADDTTPEGASTLITFADCLPPAALGAYSSPATISTMTWAFDILAPDLATARFNWLRLSSRTEAMGSGYASQTMDMTTPDGRTILRGRQLIAVFG
jgi:hypothetical protein